MSARVKQEVLKQSTPSSVNRRTLKAGVDYVNNALATFGFPSPLTFVGASAEEAEKTVNCIMAMLLERQKDIEYKTEVDERYRKLQSENDAQHASIQKLQSRLDGERREKEASQLKLGYSLLPMTCRILSHHHQIGVGAAQSGRGAR